MTELVVDRGAEDDKREAGYPEESEGEILHNVLYTPFFLNLLVNPGVSLYPYLSYPVFMGQTVSALIKQYQTAIALLFKPLFLSLQH